jgi:hypothetical protein
MILKSNSFKSPGMVEVAAIHLNDRVYRAWTPSEIIMNINFEQKKLASAINQRHRDYFMSSATQDSVASQSTYSLPSDLAKLWGIEIADSVSDKEPRPLVEVMLDDRMFYTRLEDANEKSAFGFYYISGTDFVMEPGVTDASKTIRVYYIKQLVDFVTADDTDKDATSEIPVQHHEMLPLGAVRRCLSKVKRVNKVVESLYAEGFTNMMGEITHFSAVKEERRQPFYGSYSPGRVHPYFEA